MEEYKPDLSKILVNPFAFKDDPKEAEAELGHYLTRIAQFFRAEIQGLGEVEAALNRYQGAKGRHGVLRLGSSIDHVSGVQRDLEAIDACDGKHYLGRLGS